MTDSNLTGFALGRRGELIPLQEIEFRGDELTLRGPVLRDVYRLMLLGVQTAEIREGIAPNARLATLLTALQRATSALPVSEVRESPTSQESKQNKRIGSGEAAVRMNISERQVRNRASDLDGRKVAGRWTYDEALVDAAAQNRT